MNNKINYSKYIVSILFTFALISVIHITARASRTCTIQPGESGCCTYDECGGWTGLCFDNSTPTIYCPAPAGQCVCNLGYPGYCNPGGYTTPGCSNTHDCDKCCCSLSGGGGGGGGEEEEEPNIWYGVMGTVWSDFNNNGTRDEGEDWKGLPQYDTDGRCAPTTHQQDFSVIVNGENIARAWWCVGTPRIHTTRFEYYSHHDGAPGWINLSAGMRRGEYFSATLGNLPSGSSCGTWTVYNSDGSFETSGTGCTSYALFTTVNNYMRVDWKLVSANIPPKGWHDSATCISEEGPNLRKIQVQGWTCDEDDYSTPLRVHTYLDGPAGSGGTIISNTVANVLGWPAVGEQCGGNLNHVFSFITSQSFPSGDHDVYAYAINIPAGGNPLLGGSPKSVTCCSPNNPTLSWGLCSVGTQSATCNPEPSCGGSCSAECIADGGNYDSASHTCTRPCLYVEGNIWSDDNGNLARESSENWWNPNYHLDCATSKDHTSFYLTYTGHTGSNQINEWYCNGINSYYRSPFGGTIENIEPEQPHTFTLSGWPDGYKPKAWVYENSLNYSETSGSWVSGNFTTASLSMPASGWTNVHWELQQEKYNLTIKVKDIPPETEVEYFEDSCTLDLNPLDDLSGATVIISSGGVELCNKNTESNGEVTCDIWVGQGDLDITVRKREIDGEVIKIYGMVCPERNNSFTFNPGDVEDGDGITKLAGLQEGYKVGWVSAVDSDVFANEVNVLVPLGTGSNPAGYVKALLNSYDNSTGGFVFSKSQIIQPSENTEDESITYNLLFEEGLGGRAERLDLDGSNHNSKWLESFTFKAPSVAKEWTLTGTEARFIPGEVYYVENSYLQQLLNLGSVYRLSSGVSVLYVVGDITVKNPIQTPDNGRLLLIVDGSVTIDSDVGEDTATFNMSKDPHIEAGIIASGGISFESIGGSITQTTHDDPIMVSAPLISKESLTFARDLYHDNNATMPAESAKAFNKYLYLLTSLEREKSQDNLYFTGLTTFDLDWEYIY